MSYEYQDQVLGMILSQNSRYWPEVKHQWDHQIFGEVERMKIAKAIKDLNDSNQEVNYASVVAAMNGDSFGTVANLLSSFVPETNINYFLTQLTVWHRLKSLVFSASDLCQRIIKANNADLSDPLIAEFKKLSEQAEGCAVLTNNLPNIPEIIISATERIEKKIALRHEGKPNGASVGLPKLDYFISGLVGGRFYIAAARTSVGKTSFASWMTMQAMKQGYKPLFFSNEMDKEDLIEKLIASQARINTQKFQSGDLTDQELTRFMSTATEMSKLHLRVDEKSGWDLDELLTTVHRLHRQGECNIVFVDYLQQVRVKLSKSKYEQVSTVSDAMKRLSRDLNIPVVGLAQINREAEKGGKEDLPSLSQLKDSGSLEQDADVVMILHKRDIADSEVALSISKNRYGMTGVTKLRHIHHFNIYEET
jgi:replicative DNA helicase